ncbi:MAG: hypothetical protein Kow0059_07540 [Candidatus Sumerlaeia bacterium]
MNEKIQDFIRVQSQLNVFKFTTSGDLGSLLSLLLQFSHRATGSLHALLDGSTFEFLLRQPLSFWREAFGRFDLVRFYVYVPAASGAPPVALPAASPMAVTKGTIEVCCFANDMLSCCMFYTTEQMLAVQDSGTEKIGFAFPREWPFINDFTRMIETLAISSEPLWFYSNRLVFPPLPADFPRN